MCVCKDYSHSVLLHNTSKDEVPNGVVYLYIILIKIMTRGIIFSLSNYAINTFTAIVDLSRFNNSCLKLPASTLVDLTFESHALRSFSLNQLRNLSL